VLRAAEMDFQKPVPHGVLGIPGYVQFTSPIRRYVDLLAHYQIKAFLRGESPPYSAGDLEGMTFIASMHVKVARRLHSNNLRYWLLEYLRRQPKGKKYKALILKFIKDRLATLLVIEVHKHASSSTFLFDIYKMRVFLLLLWDCIWSKSTSVDISGLAQGLENQCNLAWESLSNPSQYKNHLIVYSLHFNCLFPSMTNPR
jgi:hypothetical protein